MTEGELYQKQVNTCKQVQNMINELYISKDKIREKIKEIENRRIEEGQCELALYGFIREGKIDVLKELLEED